MPKSLLSKSLAGHPYDRGYGILLSLEKCTETEESELMNSVSPYNFGRALHNFNGRVFLFKEICNET